MPGTHPGDNHMELLSCLALSFLLVTISAAQCESENEIKLPRRSGLVACKCASLGDQTTRENSDKSQAFFATVDGLPGKRQK
jgi:hypothetical protein